jgi:hypothetical protein
MKKFLAATLACGLFVSAAHAANDKVDSAVKTFEAVANDAAKLKTYCEMNKLMNSASDDKSDNAKDDALDKQIQDYMGKLGSEFETAFEAGADLDPDSEDGKAYDAALDKLDAKCGG